MEGQEETPRSGVNSSRKLRVLLAAAAIAILLKAGSRNEQWLSKIARVVSSKSNLTERVKLLLLYGFVAGLYKVAGHCKQDKLKLYYDSKMQDTVQKAKLEGREVSVSWFGRIAIAQFVVLCAHQWLSTTWRKSSVIQYEQEVFQYKDGGTIHLDWAWSSTRGPGTGFDTPLGDTAPILVLVPGVNNDSGELGIQSMVRRAVAHGFHVTCIG